MNVHAVFFVKGSDNFITDKWSDELPRYIAGTLKETKNKIRYEDAYLFEFYE